MCKKISLLDIEIENKNEEGNKEATNKKERTNKINFTVKCIGLCLMFVVAVLLISAAAIIADKYVSENAICCITLSNLMITAIVCITAAFIAIIICLTVITGKLINCCKEGKNNSEKVSDIVIEAYNKFFDGKGNEQKQSEKANIEQGSNT